jgi:hypothetical protein
MTPWEEQQSRALDRRAFCLFIESSFEDSVKHYEREIERCIKDGKMPTRGYPKLLRMIASVRGGEAAQRAAQHAQVLLQKYFSPEGQRTIRNKCGRYLDRMIPQSAEARYHEIRLQLVERFEIGGCFSSTGASSLFRSPRLRYRYWWLSLQLPTGWDSDFPELIGKVDFEKIKAEICQRFPAVS